MSLLQYRERMHGNQRCDRVGKSVSARVSKHPKQAGEIHALIG